MHKECCAQHPKYEPKGKKNVSKKANHTESSNKLYRLFKTGHRIYSEYAKLDRRYF